MTWANIKYSFLKVCTVECFFIFTAKSAKIAKVFFFLANFAGFAVQFLCLQSKNRPGRIPVAGGSVRVQLIRSRPVRDVRRRDAAVLNKKPRAWDARGSRV